MRAHAAVGIAAPQVGRHQRILILDCSGRPKVRAQGHLVLVNPEIVHWEGFAIGREGCLSVPDFTGNVIRATRLQLQAQDPGGAPVTLDAGIIHFKVGQRKAVAFEIADEVVKLEWAKPK